MLLENGGGQSLAGRLLATGEVEHTISGIINSREGANSHHFGMRSMGKHMEQPKSPLSMRQPGHCGGLGIKV